MTHDPQFPGPTHPEHVGEVWHTNRMANEPAVLRLSGGRLSLIRRDGVVFDERVADLERIHVPWYWFGGGIVVTVAGRKQKVAFVRPNGAEPHDPGRLSLLDAAGLSGLVTGASAFTDVSDLARGSAAALSITPGLRAGRTWRALLGV